MRLDRFLWWTGAVFLAIILLHEFAYGYWKAMNRGEHWSHLLGQKTGTKNWNETIITEDAQLNRSWSGRF